MAEYNTTNRTNRVVLMISWFLDLSLVAGYLVEVIKGTKGLPFFLLLVVLLMVPVIWSTLIYKRNPFSLRLRTIILIGYFVFYNVALFSADNVLVYAYFFPIMATFFLYYEISLIVIFGTAVLISNIAHIGWLLMSNPTLVTQNSSNYTILMASIMLFFIAMYLATRLSNEFNEEKLVQINQEKDNLVGILKEVGLSSGELAALAGQMQNTSQTVASTMEQISASTEEIAAGMEEVLASMQHVSASSVEIGCSLEVITGEASKGAANAKDIKSHAATMENNALNAKEKTTNIQKTISQRITNAIEQAKVVDEISSLAEAIGSIADQTNLLALNAAIEAARAGDSGRGFAVVAEEVRKLAEQSSQSVNSIKTLTNQVHEATDNLIKNASSMIEFVGNDVMNDYGNFVTIIQKNSTDADMFAGITNRTSEKNSELQIAVENINHSIDMVSMTMEQSTEGTQEIARASMNATQAAVEANEIATRLADQATKLSELANRAN